MFIAKYKDASAILNVAWFAMDAQSQRRLPSFALEDPLATIEFHAETIRTVCGKCVQEFPFKLHRALEPFGTSPGFVREYDGIQVFALAYQCQGCDSSPDVFLVRRKGLKIMLCGRAPIELVRAPAFIPKDIRQFHSDALVAYNSGQVLAGLFLLRTVIEQYVRRRHGGPGDHPDQILDRYMESLPLEFKGKFPSFKNLYADLSVAIHEANASTELFENTIRDIDHHFDAKRIFRISDS